MIVNARAWLHGILLPLTEPTIPAGQGLIDLSLFERIGGGSLGLFNDLGILFLAAGLWFLFFNYTMLKPAIFLMPSLILFWTSRSFGSYLIDLLPFAILSGLTITPTTAAKPDFKKWQTLGRVGFSTVFALLLSLIILHPSPLTIAVKKIHAVGKRGPVTQIILAVKNQTNHFVHPYFTLTTTGQTTSFWISSRTMLPPHQTSTITLQAPNKLSMPAVDSDFIVNAFTTNPDTLGSSTLCRAWTIARS